MHIQIQNRALLRISGVDAESFLQSQLTNEISLLEDSNVELSAYFQHQGKIIALFWLMRFNESFILSFPIDLAE